MPRLKPKRANKDLKKIQIIGKNNVQVLATFYRERLKVTKSLAQVHTVRKCKPKVKTLEFYLLIHIRASRNTFFLT